MVKSTCSAKKYCISATYKDDNRKKKQGWSMGCDQTDCTKIDQGDAGWEVMESGHICKKDRDYGSDGRVCCCTKDFCNGAMGVVGMHVVAALLMWVIA